MTFQWQPRPTGDGVMPGRFGAVSKAPALALGHLALCAVLLWPVAAAAQRVENGIAVFAALDKVTARISKLEVKLGETVRFGALKVTPRACYSRPPTEPPKTTSFVEVQEILLDGKEQRIFSGWMFAENPGLNAVEHPVFDVWLTECNAIARPVAAKAPGPGAVGSGKAGQPATAAAAAEPAAELTPEDETPPPPPRRTRPRR